MSFRGIKNTSRYLDSLCGVLRGGPRFRIVVVAKLYREDVRTPRAALRSCWSSRKPLYLYPPPWRQKLPRSGEHAQPQARPPRPRVPSPRNEFRIFSLLSRAQKELDARWRLHDADVGIWHARVTGTKKKSYRRVLASDTSKTLDRHSTGEAVRPLHVSVSPWQMVPAYTLIHNYVHTWAHRLSMGRTDRSLL